jgi:hypothetical protein
MDISSLMQRLQTFISSMDLGMEPKTFALLVAILLFLTSFLVNLLQRRYSKARVERMLKKEESIVTFLEGIAKYLNEQHRSSIIEMDGERSLKEMVKAIDSARDTIEWTLDDLKIHLSSLRQYRRKEEAQEKKEPTL